MPEHTAHPHSRIPGRRGQGGFSLVEMMVALLFTALLMGGMSTVFRSSLGTFMTTGEQLASSRRNRLALEMLYDDLNSAGMYMTNLGYYPTFQDGNEGFFLNRETVPGTDLPTNRLKNDQLYLYFDDPLPFEGTLQASGPSGLASGPGLSTLVSSAAVGGGDVGSVSNAFTVVFPDSTLAQKVKAGQFVVFRNGFDVKEIQSVSASGSAVTITPNPRTQSATGVSTGGSGAFFADPQIAGKNVLVVNRAQQVRYCIRGRAYDPENPSSPIPCLVREQVNYGDPFTDASANTSVIAENVSRFQVFMSLDGGTTWFGMGGKAAGQSGWDSFKSSLDTELAKAGALSTGRPGVQAVTGNPNWFREIPVLVRVEVTTRSPKPLREYYNPDLPLASQYPDPTDTTPDATQRRYFNETTRTLILMPRHFGLPY